MKIIISQWYKYIFAECLLFFKLIFQMAELVYLEFAQAYARMGLFANLPPTLARLDCSRCTNRQYYPSDQPLQPFQFPRSEDEMEEDNENDDSDEEQQPRKLHRPNESIERPRRYFDAMEDEGTQEQQPRKLQKHT